MPTAKWLKAGQPRGLSSGRESHVLANTGVNGHHPGRIPPNYVLARCVWAVHELPADHSLCGADWLAFYALLFAPTIGALMGRSGAISENDASALRSLESGRTENISGITAVYARILDLAVRMPVAVFVLSILMLITIVTAYGRYGKGVEFFTGSNRVRPRFRSLPAAIFTG